MYGRVAQYTFDPKFKPTEASKFSRDSLEYEDQFVAMRPLRGTAIRLKNIGSESEQTMRAASNGDFSFDNLRPGRYEFAVGLPSVMDPV